MLKWTVEPPPFRGSVESPGVRGGSTDKGTRLDTGLYSDGDEVRYWISTAVPPTKQEVDRPIGVWARRSGDRNFLHKGNYATIGDAVRALEAKEITV